MYVMACFYQHTIFLLYVEMLKDSRHKVLKFYFLASNLEKFIDMCKRLKKVCYWGEFLVFKCVILTLLYQIS